MQHPGSAKAERIHLSAPHMTASERRAVINAFDSNWIAPVGPALDGFEQRLRRVSGREAAVAVNSGTAALHLAMLTLDIGPGDIVLCPSVTFVASANVIRYVGAIPHFVDCDSITGNMCPDSLEQALVDLTAVGHAPAAVMVVDLYGTCADYARIAPLCKTFGVPIVEDAAESIGATYDGRPAGSFGVLAAFSFNGNKMATTGGGGALVGPADLIKRASFLAGQAREPELHFEHHEVGYAYRLSNVSAAIGCAQLDRLDSMVARTRAINQRYVMQLGSIDGVTIAPQNTSSVGGVTRGNGWLSVMHLDPSLDVAPLDICKALAAENIEARPTWKPMHLQPVYSMSATTGGNQSAAHYATGVCLPSGSSMSNAEQARVINAVRSALGVDTSVIDVADSITLKDEQPQLRQDSQTATR